MSIPSYQKITPRGEDDNDDDFSPEDLVARRRKRRWIIAMCVIILMGSLVAFNARSISRGIKGWQAERAAKESEKFLAAKDFKSAQAKLQDALALSPTNTAGMFAAARFLTAAGSYRDALAFWKQLEQKTSFSQEDQRQYATSLLATGDLLLAEKQLKLAWPSGTPGTPDDWMIALSLAMQKRDDVQTVSLAKKIMDSSDATADQRLRAATLLTSVSQPEQRNAAWKIIETLSQQKVETGLEALVTLAQRSAAAFSNKTTLEDSTIPTPQSIADALDANPKSAAKHFLFAMDLRLLIDPLRKNEMIKLAEEKFTKSDDDLEALTAWLYGKGEFRKILTHLPANVASHRRSLFLQSLDAMAAMGQWKEVADAINGASFSLDRVTAEMYLARCSKELGEKAATDNHWQAAINAANGNPQQLMLVADYAEKAGNIAVAKTGFLAATEARSDLLPAFQRLLVIAQAEGDTVGLNTLLKRMSLQWPDEGAVRNDLAYTDLLLQKNMEEATKTAEALFAKDPQSLPYRITLSLAKLRSGNFGDATDVLDNLTGNMGPLEGRKLAVQAAALWAGEKKSEAQTTLQNVKLDSLFPEERALVAEIPPLLE